MNIISRIGWLLLVSILVCGLGLLFSPSSGLLAAPEGWNLPAEACRCYSNTAHNRDLGIDAKKGRIYAATDGGLLVFAEDGILLGKYTLCDGLPSQTLNALQIDAGGRVWLASTEGVIRWDQGEITSFTKTKGLNHNLVYALGQDRDGVLYAGTAAGINVLKGRRFQPLNDSHEFSRRPVLDIHTAVDGSLWFVKQNALSHALPQGLWQIFYKDVFQKSVNTGLANSYPLSITSDQQGMLWLGSRNGLSYFTAGRWHTLYRNERADPEPGLKHNWIATLAADRRGGVWIGYGPAQDAVGGLGLSYYQNGQWRHLTEKDGLPSNYIYRLKEDNRGDLWLATPRGLARFREGEIKSYFTAGEMPSNHIINIYKLGVGKVAVLTSGGLNIFQHGNPEAAFPLPDTEVTATAASGTTILVGSRRHGLFYLSASGWQTEDFFKDRSITALAVAPEGEIWVADVVGVYRGQIGNWTRLNALSAYPGVSWEKIFPGPDGQVWLWGAGAEGGLFKLINERAIKQTVNSGHTQIRFKQIFFASYGMPWLAHDNGLYNLSKEPGRRSNQLPCAEIGRMGKVSLCPAIKGLRVIVRDADDRFWAGFQDQGLWRRQGKSWVRIRLADNDFPEEITSLCWEDRNILWVGTAAQGAIRLHTGGERLRTTAKVF